VATVPTPPDFTDGASSSSQLNQLRDAIKFLQRPPNAQLRQAVVQAVTTAVWTAITFDAEDIDDDTEGTGGHSTSSNTSRYTARYPGRYDLGGGMAWASNNTGVRGTYWSVNGVAQNGSQTLEATINGLDACYSARSIEVYLAVGDYLELFAYQSSGGNLNTGITSAVEQPSAKVRWVSI
jgi:hypothetical protein